MAARPAPGRTEPMADAVAGWRVVLVESTTPQSMIALASSWKGNHAESSDCADDPCRSRRTVPGPPLPGRLRASLSAPACPTLGGRAVAGPERGIGVCFWLGAVHPPRN